MVGGERGGVFTIPKLITGRGSHITVIVHNALATIAAS